MLVGNAVALTNLILFKSISGMSSGKSQASLFLHDLKFFLSLAFVMFNQLFA